jgi:hypothetical protein
VKSRKRDEVDNFKAWLVGRGAELLVTTNEWEVVRFKGGGVTSIIYQKLTGQRTFTGQAQAAWEAFKKNDPDFRLAVQRPPDAFLQRNKRNPPVIETLIARDGDECFYCGMAFRTPEARTREHLIAQAHGGPNHISNIFLACVLCNTEAGHLSAPEKIRLREFKRGFRDSPNVGEAAGTGLASSAAFNEGENR